MAFLLGMVITAINFAIVMGANYGVIVLFAERPEELDRNCGDLYDGMYAAYKDAIDDIAIRSPYPSLNV